MPNNHPNAAQSREEKTPPAGQPVDRLRQAGAQALDKAEDALRSVGQMASNALPAAGQAIGQAADNLTEAAGAQLKGLGETMAHNTPREGLLGRTTQGVAHGLERGGDYLAHAGISGLFSDVSDLIRRNPLPAVLLGLGFGYWIGRMQGNRG